MRALSEVPKVEITTSDPDGLQFTLEGCRNDGTITLPNGAGKFICPDPAYTTGNLGKGWNELDLVPFRVTVQAGKSAPATQTYSFAIVLDYKDAGKPGYDVLAAPVLNVAKSSASCVAADFTAELHLLPGLGGADDSIYRYVEITQSKESTCVYDYYGRLALGSHLYPGSSLHANLGNNEADLGTAGIGSKEVSIPVKEILPQELSKDMSATQGADYAWNLEKKAMPASVDFGNTCDPNQPTQDSSVEIVVKFTKLAATPGGITFITHVYAKNPASRIITVDVTDKVYAGATPSGSVLDSATSVPVDVPANTTLLVLTHTKTIEAGPTQLTDEATATYTDKVTGVPVPGNTTATATADVLQTGPVTNNTAKISDTETISGANLSFSVDSVVGATGSFTDPIGYALGSKANPIAWTSDPQSGTGQVTFGKTIYVTGPTNTTGTLADIATLLGSDGYTTANAAEASISIQSSAKVSLKITKTIPNVLQAGETQSFTMHVKDGNGVEVATPVFNFAAGETSKDVTISGLEPGTFTVTEDTASPWNAQDSQTKTLDASSIANCSGALTFNNTLPPAAAKVVKTTVPAGGEAGWQVILKGTGLPADGVPAVTDPSGIASFPVALGEGSYTIEEVLKPGYDQTGATGCTFTVNFPGDAGKGYKCYFENTAPGTITVKKFTDPTGSTQLFDFASDFMGAFQLADGGSKTSDPLKPGTYKVYETVPAGWDLTSATCDDGSPIGAISLQAGENVTCTFKNVQRGLIIVKKVTYPAGSPQFFDFTSTFMGTFQLADGQSKQSEPLVPGNAYAVSENVPAGWDLAKASCDDGSAVSAISLSAGETVTCTFTNVQRAQAEVIKTQNGAPPTLAFTFPFSGGPDNISITKTTDSQNLGTLDFGLVKPGDYKLCELMVPAGVTSTLQTYPGATVDTTTGDVCAPVTLAAGETKVFNIDNIIPLGGQRTIGYWKNWNTCSGSSGNQTTNAAKTGHKLVDELLPIELVPPFDTYAGVNVTTCAKAVEILTTASMKYAEHGVAAQLMASLLNVKAAGGMACGAATAAINTAQSLLQQIKWSGAVNTQIVGSKHKLYPQFAAVNTQLDLFNNGKLCL